MVEFSYLTQLRHQHPAWKLLCADSAPLIVSFLYRAFIQPNARSIRQSILVDELQDYLYHLHRIHGPLYPKTAQQYLDDWAKGETAFLRKYYPDLGDEPEYDLIPSVEKAIEWLKSLKQRSFVGTESRLLMVIQLLRDIVQATETDPDARIRELERRRAEIDQEIARLKDGVISPYSPTQIKEQFFQAEETARRLLSDFRQVEENFRKLDRQTRERIATSDLPKGQLLDEIFGEQNAISDSDQGKTFRAFWSFLMSPLRQEELEELISRVLCLGEIRSLEAEELLSGLKIRLMEAGEKVQKTSATLIEQLRKYLDDQVWLENKRIMGIIHGIEKQAIAIRQTPPPEKAFAFLDELKPALRFPMARGFFVPTEKARFDSSAVDVAKVEDIPDTLFELRYVDEQQLRRNIRRMLAERPVVTLEDVLERYPLEQGLGEVVTYLRLACEDAKAIVDSAERQLLSWEVPEGKRCLSVPKVVYTQ